MKFEREGFDGYIITPENKKEKEQLEKSLGWTEPNTLECIICQLKGYGKK